MSLPNSKREELKNNFDIAYSKMPEVKNFGYVNSDCIADYWLNILEKELKEREEEILWKITTLPCEYDIDGDKMVHHHQVKTLLTPSEDNDHMK